MAIYEDWLYFETPDCYLISLNVKDGKERWRKQICDIDSFYYASVAPTVIKDHLIVGVSGDDFDIPGYIQSHHPESGDDAVALVYGAAEEGRSRLGDRGRTRRWPEHGGGMTWQPVTYDPELNYVYVTTGNPQPVIAHKNRPGDNLFTGLDRRGQRRHGQDGLAFPVLAARHARLGLDADGRADRRRA